VQPVYPSPVYPFGHCPQFLDPGILVQRVRLLHPPLLTKHSLMSTHPSFPVPLYPEGHGPQLFPPFSKRIHCVRLSHPPLFVEQALITIHPVFPVPLKWGGQEVQLKDPGVSVQLVKGSHGEGV